MFFRKTNLHVGDFEGPRPALRASFSRKRSQAGEAAPRLRNRVAACTRVDPAMVRGLRQHRRSQDGDRSLPPFRAEPLPPTTRLQHRGASGPATLFPSRRGLRPERAPEAGVLARSGIWRNIRGASIAQPLSRISRDLSRFQSRAFSVSRLSWSFLPLPRAMAILARPLSLK
jgi:hypothetical protein